MNIFTTSILYCKQDKVPQELLLQTTVLRVISESNAPKPLKSSPSVKPTIGYFSSGSEMPVRQNSEHQCCTQKMSWKWPLCVCVSKDISNAGRFLEVFLHLHFFMQWLLTRWQKMTAHCQDLEAVKLALSLSPFCVPVKWEFPDSIWRAQISLRPTNEQRALWEKRARLTAQTGKCGTGTTMFSSVCKTLFLFFFFCFKPTVWCNFLLGRPLQTKAALPPHHFRDRIYCCSLGAEPSASEDSVWMTSQLCNRPILKNMVCVYLWGNIWNDRCWCGSKCSAFSWIVFNDSRVNCFLCLSHRVSPQNGILKLRNWKNKIKRFSWWQKSLKSFLYLTAL